ncbi:histidinol-phosphatase [Planococcus lenghuensis]|uniref:Histidinol-phosphatase n=1 Tax=Planococcus lenghuensis TaxID=2213202 RepID=A0A1Q2KZG6_9BACL|nr:histidinol-phosphatase [Planococcus lenghuensis]AQQ53581.1 histidinol phosphatase [Planococcus lenghuensis]
MLTDYHVHMIETGEFTVDWLKNYVKQAKNQGIDELGISEHAYFFNETSKILSNPWIDNRRGLDFRDYLSLFEQAKEEGLPVKMGIEMDYTPGKEREINEFIDAYPFDYVIGSVHWIGDWGIDLKEHKAEYEKRDIAEAYEAYFDQIVSLAQSGTADFVGHIDLIKIFKYKPNDAKFVEAQYDRAVKALAASDMSIEISTAGLRKTVGEIYPDPLLLKKCFEAGVTIVLSSDAHHPDHVGYGYDQSVKLAKDIGYREVQTFTSRKREVKPLG